MAMRDNDLEEKAKKKAEAEAAEKAKKAAAEAEKQRKAKEEKLQKEKEKKQKKISALIDQLASEDFDQNDKDTIDLQVARRVRERKEKTEKRCTLMLLLGDTDMVNAAKPENENNVGTTKFTMAELPKIIRPLLEKLANNAIDVEFDKKDASYKPKADPIQLLETDEDNDNGKEYGMYAASATLENKKVVRLALYDAAFNIQQLNAMEPNGEPALKGFYDHAFDFSNANQVKDSKHCIVSVELAMKSGSLMGTFGAFAGGFDAAEITHIYTNKNKGWQVSHVNDAYTAHEIPLENVFSEIPGIKKRLDKYKAHLEAQLPKPEEKKDAAVVVEVLDAKKTKEISYDEKLATAKLDIVNDLLKVIDKNDVRLQDKLGRLNEILEKKVRNVKENKDDDTFVKASDLLGRDRDQGVLKWMFWILKALSGTIYSLYTTGSPAVWKSRGLVEVETIAAYTPKKAAAGQQ